VFFPDNLLPSTEGGDRMAGDQRSLDN